MRVDVGLMRSGGKGQEVQVIIQPEVLVLPGRCVVEMVIKSVSCAARSNEKLQA